jgi:deoxyadenosine/deoxycytidine kinase
LKTDVKTCRKQIVKRGHSYEQESIKEPFLLRLEEKIESFHQANEETSYFLPKEEMDEFVSFVSSNL